MSELFNQFLPKIKNLPCDRILNKSDILNEAFLLQEEKKLKMYYSPHNEYVNTAAKIVIVGITPGWQQTKTAYESVINNLSYLSNADLLRKAKIAASFSGTMRNNLIQMLDESGVADALNINHTSTLFSTNRDIIHTTSIIKYPVFYKDKNYTGHQPRIDQSGMLKHYVYTVFPEELNFIREAALVIPLGKSVENTIHSIIFDSKHTLLSGFPHPSGANGHRKKQFVDQKEQLISTIKNWAD
ncbi:hypothetical protein [Virgibacillus halodenitrificans]|uniref:hypothetical protein n=1 Tax=Virgibacillus halodenitrificans TaxID=1482 RepID=UPI00045CDCAF|nr:hypothetical protein [Virgibacillus halodenitrificans]MEC2157748.1 hypothetical protein [Virgibacillus halodenitrificans]CDQ31824.1 hypothetical protein BN993_01208 [Virgibacillus halodenitrificans]